MFYFILQLIAYFTVPRELINNYKLKHEVEQDIPDGFGNEINNGGKGEIYSGKANHNHCHLKT